MAQYFVKTGFFFASFDFDGHILKKKEAFLLNSYSKNANIRYIFSDEKS